MKRNKFNLSHYKLGSCDMGKLYPISCFEVLPGDTIQMHTSVFLRFAPMVAPVMHPIKVSTFSFYVPFRILWDDFEDYRTGGPDGLNSSVPPTITYTSEGGVTAGSVDDYLGVPVGYSGPFSALPHRAYAKIFNEYFRDQDLVSEWPSGNSTGSGNTNWNTVPTPASLSWEKDYFTTARPWPQKGAQVTVPVNGASGSGSVDVISNGFNVWPKTAEDYEDTSGNTVPAGTSGSWGMRGASSRDTFFTGTDLTTPTGNVKMRVQSNVGNVIGSVNIPSQLSTAHINLDQLRESFALQRFEEHRAMYGSRYTEYLRYLGVRARDSRLQRPEYLGGGKSTIQISEVLQSAADGDNPVGTLRGHGIGVNRGRTFRRFIDEDGLIMTLMSIRPIAIYMNGLNKMFSRRYKEDYWTRELEHIGQQEILTKELYATGDTTSTVNDNTVFGYNNRYDEYRSVPSTVCGEMRDLLDYWHMARSFENAPVLNSSFVSGSPTKRIFAEQTQNEIYFMAQHSVVARRILSKMGNPIL